MRSKLIFSSFFYIGCFLEARAEGISFYDIDSDDD